VKDRDSSDSSGNGGLKRPSGKACQDVSVLFASRVRRFEDIWKEFKSGSYKVDGRQVAEKMISDAIHRLRERMR